MLKKKEKESVKNWQVPSDLPEVCKASANVLDFFKPLELSEAVQFDVRLCVEEALINAMKYGSGLRREVPVDLEAGHDEKKIWMRVTDRGEGFDAGRLGDCTRGEGLFKGSGRGIYLIHQLMDEVKYNAKGNSILMVKSIG